MLDGDGVPCPFCEQAPPPRLRAGRLYLHFPLSHTFGKARASLAQAGLTVHVEGAVLDAEVPEDRMEGVIDALDSSLTSIERAGIRALIVPSGRDAQLDDFFGLESLDRLIERYRAEPLLDLVRNDQLTSVYQPIVWARDPDDVFAYEALLRGPGGVALPHTFFQTARNADLLPALDVAARRSAIRGAARHGITARIFINFAPSSIYDPDFCLRSTIETVDSLGFPHEQVVFEVIESDEVTDVAHLRNILQRYRDAGFGVALDDLGAGYASLTLLSDLRPDYVKLDMSLIRGVDADRYKALIADKLIETAHAVELPVIAEGVENVREFEWARDHGVELIQGYYIARPASPPPLLATV